MTVEQAIQIVLDLARQNIISPSFDPDMISEAEKQAEAIDTIEDFFVNVVYK